MDRDEDRFESFWEPDPNDPLDEWWVEIDLGRMVSAERIVLRFVEEGSGDPFLQFRVLVSNGEFAHGYRIVGGTTRGIRDQRLFEYVLEPDRVTAPDYTGTPLQFVTILVTDSRKGRAEEISAEEYADLDPADQGAVDYYLKSLDGGRIRADDRKSGRPRTLLVRTRCSTTEGNGRVLPTWRSLPLATTSPWGSPKGRKAHNLRLLFPGRAGFRRRRRYRVGSLYMGRGLSRGRQGRSAHRRPGDQLLDGHHSHHLYRE